jgi:hypothetical protein
MLRKIDGRWALVSKHTGRPLAYWRGAGKPPRSWVDQEERRIQAFKHEGENPLPETAMYWIVGGLTAVAAIGAVYFMSSNASAGTTGGAGATGTAAGSGTVTLPVTTINGPVASATGGSTSTSKMNFAATEANNGATYTLKVGDTLAVTLDVPSGAATFADAQVTGSGLSAGSAASLSGQTIQVFTASSAGTETISYQPVDSNSQPTGSMISFTAVVT